MYIPPTGGHGSTTPVPLSASESMPMSSASQGIEHPKEEHKASSILRGQSYRTTAPRYGLCEDIIEEPENLLWVNWNLTMHCSSSSKHVVIPHCLSMVCLRKTRPSGRIRPERRTMDGTYHVTWKVVLAQLCTILLTDPALS